ncbi:alpha/beta hydrolase fold domain-containing protein [Prosthecobacter sp.]|uniref:alpha/beta hydrolase fold domain-containing protein n=1 Tax=Prosthecobacter sp. TaxID=1965333 RepID=UPI0037849970
MRTVLLILCLLILRLPLDAQVAYPPMHRLTWEEYVGTLTHWRQKFAGRMTLESRGMSGQNMPVYLLKITDAKVPSADKQVCLVTTLHSGPERTGTTGALAFAEWCLSDDPLAVETRRKQIILVMPCVNPLAMFYTDRFRNEHGVDPYTGGGRLGKIWDVKTLTLTKPEDAPELTAVLSVIDEHRPEVHADLHGTGLQEYAAAQLGARRMYHGQIMTEVTGGAYSNYALRPWDWRVTEAMIEAGRAAGFPSDRFEADAQRTFWGPELAPLGRKLWHGMPLFYSAHYGYAKYHSMILTQEVAWEQSLVARMQGLMRIGNGVWLDERTPGYPVNRMRHFVGHYVTAYGKTAAERRASRVELWNQQSDFAAGFLYPQTVGRESFVVATTAEAKQAIGRNDFRAVLGDAAAEVERFIKAGPEIKVAMEQTTEQLLAAKTDAEFTHGIGFRLRLPYRAPKQMEIRLNGAVLKEDAADGYESWYADGFTQVQVNVPPQKLSKKGLYFVTCAYTPDVERPTGWMPPAEVQKKCATEKLDATPATFTDVPYGDHFRQTMDVWLASQGKSSPVVFYIHGGGWAAQDKTDIHQHLDVRAFLDAGISVTSINYRFLMDANAAGIKPPLQWPLQDAARALQYVRSKAEEWHLDKQRIAASGVSAGGCSSLWLGMHDDLADPKSTDAIARESTRLLFTVTKAPQASFDPQQLVEWIPNSEYGGHAFGQPMSKSRKETFPLFFAEREKLLPEIRRWSPLAHASAGDPPAYIIYTKEDKPPVKGEVQTDPSHSVLHALMLQEALRPFGVSCEVHYPNDGKPATTMQELLMQHLKSDQP